jgi:ABC-type bacteriocin/lantibiotic exporter with double-glycine peptidase domain
VFKTIKNFFYLVDSKYNYKIFSLLFLILILAIFEVLSIGAIIPFIYAILSEQNFFLLGFLKNIIDFNSYNLIKFSLILIFLVFLIKNIIVIFFIYFQSSLSSNIRKDLSEKLYNAYLNIDYKNFLKKHSSEFIKNLNVECENFRYTLFIIISSFSEIVIFFFIIGFILIYNPFFSFFVLTIVIFFCFIYILFFRKILKRNGISRSKNLENLFRIVTETLTSLKEIRVLGIKSNFFKKFSISNYKYTNDVIFNEFFVNMPKVIIELTGVMLIIVVILINIDSNFSNTELIASLGVYGLAAFRILPCLNRILLGYNHLKFTAETVNKLYIFVKEINYKDKLVKDYLKSNEKILSVNSISVVNLSFSFGDKNNFLIENINFKIKKNSFIGLVGKSGSGKSTLLNIIVGLLEPYKGGVYYNKNINIYNNLQYFYKKIAYVSQEINIIDDTIKNNIAFGIEEDEIDINKLLMAVESAKLSSFVKELNMGLETILGDRGARISGGQKQRIGIARALYFNPDLIIFDESTNALDSSTEKEITDSIFLLKGKKTIIFATHQKSLLEKCDTILEISDNKLKII